MHVSILADLGFFPIEELNRICEAGNFLGGIPDPVIPGYETVNGSLGHGLGVGGGGCALKRIKSESSVFVVAGDGELHEGANWEAIMFASHHRLDNVNLIVDDNSISMLGRTETYYRTAHCWTGLYHLDGIVKRSTAMTWRLYKQPCCGSNRMPKESQRL